MGLNQRDGETFSVRGRRNKVKQDYFEEFGISSSPLQKAEKQQIIEIQEFFKNPKNFSYNNKVNKQRLKGLFFPKKQDRDLLDLMRKIEQSKRLEYNEHWNYFKNWFFATQTSNSLSSRLYYYLNSFGTKMPNVRLSPPQTLPSTTITSSPKKISSREPNVEDRANRLLIDLITNNFNTKTEYFSKKKELQKILEYNPVLSQTPRIKSLVQNINQIQQQRLREMKQ